LISAKARELGFATTVSVRSEDIFNNGIGTFGAIFNNGIGTFGASPTMVENKR
jgi:hypothetical protein